MATNETRLIRLLIHDLRNSVGALNQLIRLQEMAREAVPVHIREVALELTGSLDMAEWLGDLRSFPERTVSWRSYVLQLPTRLKRWIPEGSIQFLLPETSELLPDLQVPEREVDLVILAIYSLALPLLKEESKCSVELVKNEITIFWKDEFASNFHSDFNNLKSTAKDSLPWQVIQKSVSGSDQRLIRLNCHATESVVRCIIQIGNK